MRLAWLLACSACWTGSTTVVEVHVQDKPRTCEVRDSDVTISGVAKMSVAGRAFAQQVGPFARFDVAFRDVAGRLKLENELFVLEGDLDLTELTMRPRDLGLRDGWLEVRSATARAATEDALRIEVELPDGLEPKTVPFTLPCSGLTFAAPPDPIETTDLEDVEVPIQTQLRPRPDGPAIARVIGRLDLEDETKGRQALDASVLERRGAMTRVRFDGANPVVAWVSSLALRPPTASGLGGFGFGRSGIGRRSVSCKRDVSLYVRIERRIIRVGHVKREAQFYVLANPGDDLAVDLGVPKPDVYAFVKQAEFRASCDD